MSENKLGDLGNTIISETKKAIKEAWAKLKEKKEKLEENVRAKKTEAKEAAKKAKEKREEFKKKVEEIKEKAIEKAKEIKKDIEQAVACNKCKNLKVYISIHPDSYAYQSENINAAVNTAATDVMVAGGGMPADHDPPEIAFIKRPNRIIPVGLKLKRDRLKETGGQPDHTPYTASHSYEARASNNHYRDDEMLEHFDFIIIVMGSDLASARMEVVEFDGVNQNIIFTENLETAARYPRPVYATKNIDFLKQGSHHWQWDGYDKNGVFDSQRLRTKLHMLRLVYTCNCPQDNAEKYACAILRFSSDSPCEWVDVRVFDKERADRYGGTYNDSSWVQPEAHFSPNPNGWRATGDSAETMAGAPANPAASPLVKKLTVTMRADFKTPDRAATRHAGHPIYDRYCVLAANDAGREVQRNYFINVHNRIPFANQSPTLAQFTVMNTLVSHAINNGFPEPTAAALRTYAEKGLAACWSRPRSGAGPDRNIETYFDNNRVRGQKQNYYAVSTIVENRNALGNFVSGLPAMPGNLHLYPAVVPAWGRSFARIANNAAYTYFNFGWCLGRLYLFPPQVMTPQPAPARPAMRPLPITTGNYATYLPDALAKEVTAFKETLAHEVGHIILNHLYSAGYSTIHKYTSTTGTAPGAAGQQTHAHLGSDGDPTGLGAIEKDVMKYHRTGTRHTGIGTENDVRGIVSLATLKVHVAPLPFPIFPQQNP